MLTNAAEFTVSEIAQAVKRTVEDEFGHVRVRGEISGFRGQHSSGHAYFTLKDENASIDAVVWRGSWARLLFKPEEGLEVIATGRLTTFPKSSKYQIVIDQIEPAGAGALLVLIMGLFLLNWPERPPGNTMFLAIATSRVSLVQMFGVGLTVAGVGDAFLVRATLVPAFMRLAGEANWWAPGPLRRFHDRFGVSEQGEAPTDPPVPTPAVPAASGREGR